MVRRRIVVYVDVHPVGGTKITLRFPGWCRQCRTPLEVGEEARWYGNGVVYCLDGHKSEDQEVVNG